MFGFKVWYGLGVLVMTPHMAFGSPASTDASRDIDVCVTVAKDALEIINLDEKVLTNRCHCVRNKHTGKLPSSVNAWNETGKNSAALTLVECSKQDIMDFYADTAFKTAYARMKKRGLRVEEIKRFSVCAGEGAYAEMRRVAASAKSKTSNLDTVKFRQMYSFCEAAVK